MKGVRLITIPTFFDSRGQICIAEQPEEIPFEIKRIFWISGVPENQTRASHAHKKQSQFLVAVAGSFKVKLDNGHMLTEFNLDSPSTGLLVPSGIWITLTDFSKEAVCLVASPEIYEETEYLKEYDKFLEWKKALKEF